MIYAEIELFINSFSRMSPWSLIGLDIGKKKIGVSYFNSLTNVVLPIALIEQTNKNKQLEAVKDLVEVRSASGIVVGWPLEMNGNVGVQALDVEKTTQKLASIVSIPIYMQDERMSTALANRMLAGSHLNRKERNSLDDQLSAAIILDNFLRRVKAF